MKAGEVMYIRVRPEDVMTCIDLVKQAGMYTGGMSLATCVRIALSGLCESARASGAVPTRDGFEYMDMVGPFVQGSRKAKQLIAQQMEGKAGFTLPRGESRTPPSHHPQKARQTFGLQPLSVAEYTRLRELNEMWYKEVVAGKCTGPEEWDARNPALGQERQALEARSTLAGESDE